MGHRNRFGGRPLRRWLNAASVAAAAFGLAPLLFGGGGDEGVDILPYIDGGGGAGDGGHRGLDVPNAAEIGYIAVHGRSPVLDANGFAIATGLVVTNHLRADLFLGEPGSEPVRSGETSLDVLTKGSRKLKYGEYVPSPGALVGTPYLNLNGRFEIEDLIPDEKEQLQLRVRQRSAAAWTILIGERGTTTGPIGSSFSRIDSTETGVELDGTIDLTELRAALEEEWSGSGVDIAIVLTTPTARGVDEAWAAWNVDESRHLWDIEIKTP